MQGGSTKVCTIEGGTYTLSANLAFTSSDNGEMWVAYFGQTPVVSGASIFGLTAIGVTEIAIEGITFTSLVNSRTNVGLDFVYNGSNFIGVTELTFRWNTIDFNGVTAGEGQLMGGINLQSSLIDSNTFKNQLFPVGGGSAQGGAIKLWNGSSNNTFSHNLCSNLYGYCVQIISYAGALCNNNGVDRNIAQSINQTNVDMGAFYIWDSSNSPNPGSAVGNSFTNNEVFGNLSSHAQPTGTSAFYLDTYSSHVTVSGNICSQCGNWPLQFNSLNNDTITNNIFDISGNQAFNGIVAGFALSDSNNTSSSFTHNIIYDSGAWPTFGPQSALWWLIVGSPPTTLSNNLYYSPTGNAPNPSGIVDGGGPAGITDTNPLNANPLFANPSANNYALSPSSPAYTDISWSTLPTDQGPVDSPFVSN